ncbi:serine--tRNA ligase [Natranaerobius thermophilus]|uniref:Serine--tRNA ligase n=1 Tax=Natranaerobius thermophilus (strain ATCC BAA-1301 / DSM 18059 / JW/NM-WN-LF) TaxID=457570 RepID=SYS_NATTJ|nr:serine--tRNA ligase [Natranaerobius thermophilus]B2A2Z8.1 RecName: Full=Serine--tRNA ligase; AltName: Full=Seryl-tRNA synthetase; Short=SerRS; AltName: Full=Seryl-tRNA(Ser/Sec) synthetase [Natranaerobius thermophilus JW/NM-WN-LF]ACB83612.1 seryl-tRNA synthetase [Natranaerobius thermophilus JW/NM-WN-LF]
MLDVKYIRNNPDEARKACVQKGEDDHVDEILKYDEQRRKILTDLEVLKNKRNTVSKEIGQLKKEGHDAQDKIAEMKEVSDKVKEMDDELKKVDEQLNYHLLCIPNIPNPDVPVGDDDEDNQVVKQVGEPVKKDYFKPHWEVAENLNLLDFKRAGKVTGTRFVNYVGDAARLERALIDFMIDVHVTEHGYVEMMPPFIANRDSMTGTGQLPKFEDDMYKLEDMEYFLIPTAEVTLTNLYRDEILPGDFLPRYLVAFTPCFRKEAGAHGRDTRGLIRQHQFNKVEMVKFVEPEKSYQELDSLVANAERVLQLLELPYQISLMCTGDLGFAAAKKYDLEVWLPSYDTYREISSCSNFEDFQARRANIRYRPEEGEKARFVHTLNGSGLAVGRTLAAILENYQNPDGTVTIPEVLKPYFNGRDVIS